MPVLFYLDRAYLDDPLLRKVDHITLSYTFFKSEDDWDSLEEGEEERA